MCFYKPGSVKRFLFCLVIYLGGISQHPSIDLPFPTAPQAKHPDEQPGIRGLFGLSAHKVYPAFFVTIEPVVSYTTISPLPQPKPGRYIFCGTGCSPNHYWLDPFPLGSMALYAARTFLSTFKVPRQGETHLPQRLGFVFNKSRILQKTFKTTGTGEID